MITLFISTVWLSLTPPPTQPLTHRSTGPVTLPIPSSSLASLSPRHHRACKTGRTHARTITERGGRVKQMLLKKERKKCCNRKFKPQKSCLLPSLCDIESTHYPFLFGRAENSNFTWQREIFLRCVSDSGGDSRWRRRLWPPRSDSSIDVLLLVWMKPTRFFNLMYTVFGVREWVVRLLVCGNANIHHQYWPRELPLL